MGEDGSGLARRGHWIAEALESAYALAIEGIEGSAGFRRLNLEGAIRFAERYGAKHGQVEAAIDEMVRWQIVNASATGFVTGLGGLVTLPVTLPSNLLGVLFIQIRMVAAIAHLRGYDLTSERVRTAVLMSLAGDVAAETLKEASLRLGKRVAARSVLRRVGSGSALRLAAQTGGRGALSLVRLMPLLGGVVSGAVDGGVTALVGQVARRMFPSLAPMASLADASAVTAFTRASLPKA